MAKSYRVPLLTGGGLVLGLAAVCIAILIPDSADSSPAGVDPRTTDHEPRTTNAPPVTLADPGSVVPGGVFEWPGDDATACGMGAESWTPIGSSCWYPVDLLADETSLEIWRRTPDGRQTRTLKVLDYPYPVQHLTIADDGKVNLSAEDAARANRESARIGRLWPLRSERQFSLPLGKPLADLSQGGRFGSRRFMNNQPRSPHSGADYSADTGTPVLAVEAGTVVLAEEHFFAGNSVFIDHGDGLISMSFHLDRIDVVVGDRIRRGQQVGTVGATGRVTGPHLHFGLRWRGKRINPEALIGR